MLQHILIVLGPPGSGKGTQGKMLALILNYSYLSMGQYLRAYALRDTDLAKRIKQSIDSGHIISDELFDQVFPEVKSTIRNSNGIIFDGFPRDEAQVPILENLISELNVKDIKVVFLDVPKEKLLSRLHKREKSEDRADDSPEVIGTRFDEYMHKSLPVIEYFEKKGWLIRVNGDQSIEATHDEIVKKLGLEK